MTAGVYWNWYLIDSLERKHHLKWLRIYGIVEKSVINTKIQYKQYSNTNIAFTFLDKGQTSLLVFIQSQDSIITASPGFLSKSYDSEETIFAEHYFVNDQLLQSVIKNME